MIKIAIIGLGVMGKNHYRVLQEIPDVRIVSVCDKNIDNIYSCGVYRDYKKMLAEVDIDAIIISTPTFLHKEMALKCIEYGINILIEKPVASTIKEAKEILEYSRTKNVKVVIGHVERFNPVVSMLKREIEDKEIYSVNITRVGPFPPRISDVGVLVDLSVHDVDLIRFILKTEIKRTNIFKSKKIHNHYEDNAILSFFMENDVTASIVTNWLTPFKKRKIEVACKNGYYEADLMTQELIEYSDYKLNNSFLTRNCFVKKSEPLLNELAAFIKYVKNGNVGINTTIEDSIKTLLIVSSD
jgi:predicted dehydrogenase